MHRDHVLYMKLDNILPLILLVAVSLGCSQLRDMAGGNGAPANSPNAESPISPEDNRGGTVPGGAPSGDPKTDINRMADAFIAQKMFRAKMVGSGQTPMNMELEFVAPDRFRIKSSQGPQTVIIGRDVYIQLGDRWMKSPEKLNSPLIDIRKTWDEEGRKWLSDVKQVGEETVNGEPAYVYTYHNKGLEGVGENDSKIWVSKAEGLPVRIEAIYKGGTLKSMTIDYDYDANISIEPPI